MKTPLPAIGHRTTAEALGCGDAAILRTQLRSAAPLIHDFLYWLAKAFGGMGEDARRWAK
jgi:hypothetical protein